MPKAKKPKRLSEQTKLEAPPVVQQVYKDYLFGMENLTKPYVFFNEKSPLEYWADGRLRFNVYVPQRKKNTKEWRTLYRSAVTRNKCLGIIAHLVGMGISPSIQAQNEMVEEDVAASQFFSDSVEYSQEKENFNIKLFWAIATAVAEGTVILEDNYGVFKRDIKDIDDIDEDTGKIKWTEKSVDEWSGAFTDIVPNDEILIPDPFITNIQDQPWIIRRRRMTIEQFRYRYQHYENAKDVIPGGPNTWTWTSDFFQPYSSVSYLAHNMVEVITRWQKDGDHMDVVANGVQLSDDNAPNPRKDKKYPFAKSGYEPIDYNFFWYKSLTDKTAPEQDLYDAMLRMLADRQHLKNIPPLFTTNPALVNEEIVIPGNMVYVGSGPDAKVSTIPGFDSNTDAGTANILATMMENMNSSSIDPMQTGNAPQGGTPTATQAIQMAYNARIMLGLFGFMVGMLITEWTKLRINTIIWRLSSGMDLSRITMSDRILSGGIPGKRTYVFEPGLAKSSQDQKMALSMKIRDFEQKMNGKHEIVALDSDALADLSTVIRVDAQLKPRRTDELMQALAMEKWNVYSQRPDVFNVNAAAIKLAQAWGDNPDEFVLSRSNPTAPQPQQGVMSGMPPQPNQPSTPVMNQMQGGLKQKLGMPAPGPNQASINALA